MTTAVTVAIAVYLAAVTSFAAWIVRAWRRECRLAARITRAQQRARLQQQMHLRRSHDQLGPDDDWAHKLLADIHALPTTTRERGNQ